MNTAEALATAARHLAAHDGHVFDDIFLARPRSMDHALTLARVISKISPLIGNLIELDVVDLLNDDGTFAPHGRWRRQDPDFPDAVLEGTITPRPGIEIKAWFPLATEITARFRESQDHLSANNISLALVAWIPEGLFFGKPKLIRSIVVPAISVATARDNHYFDPPSYLVVEPQDTSNRTRNLQQTNTAGYRWQGSPEEFGTAQQVVQTLLGTNRRRYTTGGRCQNGIRDLMRQYSYRLDTNFAKIDRIAHPEIEAFKSQVLSTIVHGLTLSQWSQILASDDEARVARALEEHLDILGGA